MGPSVAPDLDHHLTEQPVRVSNTLQAIGEIAHSGGRNPIVAALMTDTVLANSGRGAAEAIKRVDPSVLVIRLATVPDSTEAAAPAGVDATLALPVDAAALQDMLGEGLIRTARDAPSPGDPGMNEAHRSRAEAGGVDPDRPTPSAASAERSASEEEDTAAGPGNLDDPRVPTSSPTTEPPVQARDVTPVPREAALLLPLPFGAESAGKKPAWDALDLGDTDLVRAMMDEPEGVREAALALIRQQTGWSDVALREAGPETPTEASAEVRFDERYFGRLASAMALEKQLRPWAQWLATWLALDAAYREYRLLTFTDDLTGAWNRRYFNRFLDAIIVEAARLRRPLTVMVFDIDEFKRYNDRYGHEAGDVILRETVSLLNSVIRRCDRVCRIGGDEFAVIFADLQEPREAGSHHPATVEEIATRFQKQICTMQFPKLGLEAPGTLSISGGMASFPWDGHDATTLLRLADQRAMESKRKGKNHITFGPDVARGNPSPEC